MLPVTLDPSDLPAQSTYTMSSAQELANALTMMIPSGVLFVQWLDIMLRPQQTRTCLANVDVTVVLLGSVVHMPVSVAYHICCAFRRYPDRLDNDLRRLDQSMQHAVSVMFSYALSGSLLFALLNCAVNAFCIARLWDPAFSNDGRRWRMVLLSILLYTLPMLWRRDFANYAAAAAALAVGGTCFVPAVNTKALRGWGHAVFHVAVAAFAAAMARSAASRPV
jgi:hypothetical protein